MMYTRLAATARPLSVAVACCALVALAGCSSSGNSPASSGAGSSPSAGKAMNPSQVLTRAADVARSVTSFTASMAISSGGAYPTNMTGTLAEQTKPTLLAEQTFKYTSTGGPGSMETLLTSKAVYLKIAALKHLTGKPWVVVPFSALKKSVGASFGPLIHQMQANNPLGLAQMLPASSNVHEVGAATIGGVATTEYAGTYSISAALARLGAGFRKSMQAAMAATGLKTAEFHVWVDGQGQMRKVVVHEGGSTYHVTSTILITSINQPVSIHVPPASQVSAMPGL